MILPKESMQVSQDLKRLCHEKNFQLINRENTITERLLNESNLIEIKEVQQFYQIIL